MYHWPLPTQSLLQLPTPVTESLTPAAADAAPDPVIDFVAPEIECTSHAAANAAPAPLIDCEDPVHVTCRC